MRRRGRLRDEIGGALGAGIMGSVKAGANYAGR
jgi:hypothetical protein